jgi:catechol 2,3-dioxygenase-like lactoylglutathione lyase family enzyme
LKPLNGLVWLAVGIVIGATPAIFHAQTPANGFHGELRHIGYVVRDAEKTTRAWADTFGAEILKPRVPVTPSSILNETKHQTYPPNSPYNPDAGLRFSHIRLGNLEIEFIEPVGGPSPWQEHLTKRGEGLEHLRFVVTDPAQAVAFLVSRGGTPTFGNPPSYVDFPNLGVSIEVTKD